MSLCKLIPDSKLRNRFKNIEEGGASDSLTQQISNLTDKYNTDTGDDIRFVHFDNEESYGYTNICFADLHCMYYNHIFKYYSAKEIRSYFVFNDSIVKSKLYKYLRKRRGTYDCAHVRRGDIAEKNYTGAASAISIESYKKAIRNQGGDPDKIIWISDDPNIKTPCKWSKYCKDNWNYPEGQEKIPTIIFDFLPDFLTMFFSRNLFRANSSLSWWAGFLGQCTVFSPVLKDHMLCESVNFMDCDFVKGNWPHFMGHPGEGPRGTDIIFGD